MDKKKAALVIGLMRVLYLGTLFVAWVNGATTEEIEKIAIVGGATVLIASVAIFKNTKNRLL